MGIGSTVSNMVQQGVVSPTQSAPQPMGGKGGGLGTNPYAQPPSQPPQPMGGKGGIPYQPQLPDFMSPRGATTGGPRTLPAPQQPQFDDKTTQAEFDRARGITPAEQPMRPMNPYVSMDRFGGGFNPYAGGFNRGFNPYAGGYGGGFNPYAGGYGGGFNPYAGGLGGLAALMQGRGGMGSQRQVGPGFTAPGDGWDY